MKTHPAVTASLDYISSLSNYARSALVQKIEQQSREHRFLDYTKESVPHPVSLTPLVLPTSLVPRLYGLGRAVNQFHSQLIMLWLDDVENIRQLFPLNKRAIDWLNAIGPEEPNANKLFTRLDIGLREDGEPVLFETNAVGLAGMFNHDFAVQLVTEHVLSKLDVQLHHPPSLIRLMNTWLAEHVDCGQSLRIGFLEDSDFMNKTELFHAAADAEKMGINAVVGHAGQLKSGFVLDGAPIDVLLRDVAFRDLPAGPKKYPVLLQAIKDGLVIPSTSAEFGHKGILECLTSPQFERFIPAEDKTILSTVPWTRVIWERETELPDEDSGSLISFTLTHKDELLIKPNLDAGGESVLIGKDCSQNAWERRIKRALREKQQWVVQQFVPTVVQESAYIKAGELRIAPCFSTIGLFMVGNTLGLHCRISPKNIVNVARGGAVCPVFLDARS